MNPEECIFLTAPSFRSPIFWTLAPVIPISNGMPSADRRQKYVEYARGLATAAGAGAGSPPFCSRRPIIWARLADLLAAVPDATIAVCLRDPAATVPSLNSLLMTLHAVTAQQSRCAAHERGQPCRPGRGRPALHGDRAQRLPRRIVEIPYAEIRADAPRVGKRIYAARRSRTATTASSGAFGDFAAANPQHTPRRPSLSSRRTSATTAAAIRARFGDFAELSACGRRALDRGGMACG